MKNPIIKSLDLSKRLSIAAVGFWFIETTFFLIRDGLHWNAVSLEEEICDQVVVILVVSAVFFYFTALGKLMRQIVDPSPKKADLYVNIEPLEPEKGSEK